MTCFGFSKRLISPISLKIVAPRVVPTPGIVASLVLISANWAAMIFESTESVMACSFHAEFEL